MIKAIEQNLQSGITLLENLTDETYSNTSIPPYHSCIGSHVRHVLDVFLCMFNGLENNTVIDLSVRERNECAATQTKEGIAYFKRILHKIQQLDTVDLNKKVVVKDDLGLGLEQATYTLGALLMQLQSHAIHHFATIGYLVYQLGVTLPTNSFGYNPTTPLQKC